MVDGGVETRFIDRREKPIAHYDLTIDQDRLDIDWLRRIDDRRDGIRMRCSVEALQVDDLQIGLLPDFDTANLVGQFERVRSPKSCHAKDLGGW